MKVFRKVEITEAGDFAPFWQGDVFYDDGESIFDSLSLARLFDFKYIKTVKTSLVGDFCLVKQLTKGKTS